MTHDEPSPLFAAPNRTAADRHTEDGPLSIPQFASQPRTCAPSDKSPAKASTPVATLGRSLRKLADLPLKTRGKRGYRDGMAEQPDPTRSDRQLPSAEAATVPIPESTVAGPGGLDTGPGDAAADAPEDTSMQHPLLKGLAGGGEIDDPEAAALKAWQAVMNGFAEALEVTGLPPDVRARLLRCHRQCARRTRTPPIALARLRPQDQSKAV